MKSYTDIEQSRKLAEILQPESADCFWDYDDLQKYHRINWFEEGFNKESQLRLNENNVCAWSLTALLDVLPRVDIEKELWSSDKYDFRVKAYTGDGYVGDWFDNPVDACVDMIIELYEQKLL